MQAPDCFLCSDLSDRKGRISLGGGLSLTSDIAPLATGHLLLHTDAHLRSFAQADFELLTQWSKTLAEILAAPPLAGRSVLLFEHGNSSSVPLVQGCTDHAHIHVLPMPEGCLEDATSTLLEAIKFELLENVVSQIPFHELRNLCGTDYFWIADRNLNLQIIKPCDSRRQALRRIMACVLGSDRYETWDLFDEASARQTLDVWRAQLTEHLPVQGDGR